MHSRCATPSIVGHLLNSIECHVLQYSFKYSSMHVPLISQVRTSAEHHWDYHQKQPSARSFRSDSDIKSSGQLYCVQYNGESTRLHSRTRTSEYHLLPWFAGCAILILASHTALEFHTRFRCNLRRCAGVVPCYLLSGQPILFPDLPA